MGLLSCAFESATAVVAAYFLLQRIVDAGRLAAASSSDQSDIYNRGT
jgi:hypothetical protein